MRMLFLLYLLIVTCDEILGSTLPRAGEIKLKEHSCDFTLIDKTLDPNMHSLYYVRPYHSENYKEYEKSKLLSHFNTPRTPPKPNLCLSKWVENIQENRIPRIIMTAECDSMCESVTYTLPVLKIDNCEQGYFAYRQKVETISVACVPKFQESDSHEVHNSDSVPSFHVVNSGTEDLQKSSNLVQRPGITSKFRQSVSTKKTKIRSFVRIPSSVISHHSILLKPLGPSAAENLVKRNEVMSSDRKQNQEHQPEGSSIINSAVIPSDDVVPSGVADPRINKIMVDKLAETSSYKIAGPEYDSEQKPKGSLVKNSELPDDVVPSDIRNPQQARFENLVTRQGVTPSYKIAGLDEKHDSEQKPALYFPSNVVHSGIMYPHRPHYEYQVTRFGVTPRYKLESPR